MHLAFIFDRIDGADAEFDSRDVKALVDMHDKAAIESAEADDHYFFEERAVRLNLTLRSQEG